MSISIRKKKVFKKGKVPSGTIKLVIKSGKATPAPPIGPALAQKKLNIPNFCKEFNDRSLKMYKVDTPLVVVITAYPDATFNFIIKNPPASYLILDGSKGVQLPKRVIGPDINVSQLRKIAKIKMAEMMVKSEEQALSSIIGSAKSAGFNILNDE